MKISMEQLLVFETHARIKKNLFFLFKTKVFLMFQILNFFPIIEEYIYIYIYIYIKLRLLYLMNYDENP